MLPQDKHHARRPLKSRNQQWVQQLSQFCVKHKISPDQLSFFSMIFALCSGICFLFAFHLSVYPFLLILGAIFLQCRLLCNLLDGLVAIEGRMAGPIGGLMNEFPDRLSDIFIIGGLSIGLYTLPFAFALGMTAIIISLLTAYIRALAGALTMPQRFDGWQGKSQRMAVITIVAIIAACLPRYYAQYCLFIAIVIINIGGIQTCYVRLNKLISDLRQAHTQN